MRKRLYCLHGFLGRPADWDSLARQAQSHSVEVIQVDLQKEFRDRCLGQREEAFDAWVDSWIARVSQEIQAEEVSPFLLGYSLGGRLALHVWAKASELFSGAIFVSAQCGIPKAERSARLSLDEKWAQRFESSVEGWESLIRDWNQQSVFQGGRPFLERRQEEFDRSILAAQLRGWSLGQQRDLLPELGRIQRPVLWISGEKDPKYTQLSQQIQERLPSQNAFEFWVVPQAGHRVPWDCPELFHHRVLNWIFEQSLGRVDAQRSNRE